jgi:hypothetical protein
MSNTVAPSNCASVMAAASPASSASSKECSTPTRSADRR